MPAPVTGPGLPINEVCFVIKIWQVQQRSCHTCKIFEQDRQDQVFRMTKPDRQRRISRASKEMEAWPLDQRPGFLIRRMHQIHVALFQERCAEFELTPLQYSLLSALAVR